MNKPTCSKSRSQFLFRVRYLFSSAADSSPCSSLSCCSFCNSGTLSMLRTWLCSARNATGESMASLLLAHSLTTYFHIQYNNWSWFPWINPDYLWHKYQYRSTWQHHIVGIGLWINIDLSSMFINLLSPILNKTFLKVDRQWSTVQGRISMQKHQAIILRLEGLTASRCNLWKKD